MNKRKNMKANTKSIRQKCANCGCKKLLGLGWYKKDDLIFCKQCWPKIDPTIEWFEERLDILYRCIGQELDKKPPLFTLIGSRQSHVRVDDGEWLTDKVIKHLSLPRGNISFEFISLKSSIAGTVNFFNGKYQVKMSKAMENNFRAVSAILIHELMHIYLSLHGIVYKTLDEYEEATDLACVLMGFGIPMINAKKAWIVNRSALGCNGIEDCASYHILGYLSEKQIGYAFALFLSERNITVNKLKDQIDSQCFHIVTAGKQFERSYRYRLKRKQKSLFIINKKKSVQEFCKFSCPVCFQKMKVSVETMKRVGIMKTKCLKCHSMLHFDGNKIVKFIESLR